MRALATAKEKQIRQAFERETFIPQDEIAEISEAFPWSYHGTVHTQDRTFHFRFTHEGRARKGSFEEER